MTTNANIARLYRQTAKDLKRDEGFRSFAYPDPLSLLARRYRSFRWGFVPARELLARISEGPEHGHPWTVGYGFTTGVTPDSRISEPQASRKLDEKMPHYMRIALKYVPDLMEHPFAVQTVFLNMAFNMGNRLGQFVNTLAALRRRDYGTVAANLERSLWARQVKGRATYLIERVRTQQIAREHVVQ